MPNLEDTKIIVSPSPFRSPRVCAVPQGMSIRNIVDYIYEQGGVPTLYRNDDFIVEINGELINKDRWNIIPGHKDHVLVYIPVHGSSEGGKNPLRTILSIVVMVVAIAATWYFGGASGYLSAGALGISKGMSANLYGAVWGAGIMTAGTMLINAAFPISVAGLSSESPEDSPTYSVQGASNRLIPFGTIPVILGTHKFYPPLGAKPYTEIVGDDEYIRMVFVWGYGPLKIRNIKIGDTLLSSDGTTLDGEFEDVEIETVEGRSDDADLTLFPKSVTQSFINIELKKADGATTRTAPKSVDELSVDVMFPAGLCVFNNEGGHGEVNCRLRLEYREVGTDEWTTVKKNLKHRYAGVTWSLITVQSHPNTTYSLYVNTGGVFQLYQGTSTLSGYYRIATIKYVSDKETAPHWEYENLIVEGVSGFTVSVKADIVIGVPQTYSLVVASGSITYLDDPFNVTDNSTTTVRRGHRWKVDSAKNYEVRMTRITNDYDDTRIVTNSYWYVLRGMVKGDPITFPQPLAMTCLRIRATNQLNGVIDELNGEISSYAQTWDGEAWDTTAIDKVKTTSNNPAALMRLVLQHPANVKKVTSEKIDEDRYGEFYDFCASEGFEFNMIRDFTASVTDTLIDIAASACASPSFDGAHSVIWDAEDSPVVQHITPRNSWGFSSSKIFYNKPHAFRIQFVNEENNYLTDERFVYDDGYNASNATLFESLKFNGITKPSLVWKLGRYHIGQAKLRPETFTLFMDFEHLVARRGSHVFVTHDVPLWGSGSARVKEITLNTEETHVTSVTLDENVTFESGKDYSCRFRLADEDNTSVCYAVDNSGGITNTLTFTLETGIPIAVAPSVGDLAMFGETGKETTECIVKGIERSEDFTAKLTLVDVASEIYQLRGGGIPEYDPNITRPVDITKIKPSVPTIISVESGTNALEIVNGVIKTRILVNFSVSETSIPIDHYQLIYKLETLETKWRWLTIEGGNRFAYISGIQDGETYRIKIRAVSVYGAFSDWSEPHIEVVTGQAEEPPDVENFICNIIGSNAFLSWDAVPDIDYSHCEIRYSSLTAGATWGSATPLINKVGKPATSITVPAMVGSYLIKAVDYKGNKSRNASVVVSDIAALEGLNVVETLSLPDVSWDGISGGLRYDEDYGGLRLRYDYGLSGNGDYFDVKNFIEGEISNIKISAVDGNAFLDFGDMLAGYISYRIILIDSTGKKLIGYIKEAGTEETYSAEINSGTLTQYKLYIITATEEDHYGTGLEVDDYFTSAGTESCDANNKVKEVLTPADTGVTIVSAAFGETYNFKTVETGFDFADTYTYYLIESASGFINYNSMAWMEAHGVSKTIVESGYFQPSNTIDLTEVYTSRISASITSQTIDLVSSDLWEIDDLYAVPDLYFDIRSGAEVWLAVSITNDDPSGNPSWSDWKRFVIGDYTARAFRFRIYGSGTLPFTTPVISEVTITIDMPDRIVSFSGNVEIGGSNITFDAPFAIVPKIGIAIQDGSEGDTYTIENLDESGFDIYIYNGGSGVARSITGVAQGYGKKATTN